MRTTIDLPDNLFREAKVRAAQDGVKLKDLITRYVEAGLRLPRPINGSRVSGRSEFPVFQKRIGEPLPRLTNVDIEEMLVQEDVERMTVRRD
jgi:hypothetical protein